MKTYKTAGMIIAMGSLLTLASLDGAAGCGDTTNSTGGGSTGTPAGSTSAPTTDSGKATQAVAAVVFGSQNSGATSQGTTSSSGSLISALATEVVDPEFEDADPAALTTTIPTEILQLDLPCRSGTLRMNGTFSGTITQDDITRQMTAMNLNLLDTLTFNNCQPNDVTGTTSVDESQFSITGSTTGTANLQGTRSGSTTNLTIGATGSGSLTLTPVAGSTCSSGGTVNIQSNISATYNTSTRSGTCTINSASMTGTVCGQAINCTVSGICGTPVLSGTGCN